MEQQLAVETPTPATLVDEERQKLWNEFCEETFKLGQITMHIEQTKGQLAKLEKEHEVAMKKARGAADRHDSYIREKGQVTQ